MHNASALVIHCGSWSPNSIPGGSFQYSNPDPSGASAPTSLPAWSRQTRLSMLKARYSLSHTTALQHCYSRPEGRKFEAWKSPVTCPKSQSWQTAQPRVWIQIPPTQKLSTTSIFPFFWIRNHTKKHINTFYSATLYIYTCITERFQEIFTLTGLYDGIFLSIIFHYLKIECQSWTNDLTSWATNESWSSVWKTLQWQWKKKKKNRQTGSQTWVPARLSSGPDNPSLFKLQGLLVIVKYEERAESFLRSLPTLWYFFSICLIETVFPFHHTPFHYSSLVIAILSFISLQRIFFSSLLVFKVPQPPSAPFYLLSLSQKPSPPQVSALTEHHPPWHPPLPPSPAPQLTTRHSSL